jgi:hypothetical protein
MEFDAVRLDASNSPEQLADYWREKAECLEEWVCELLRKNQVLRMDLLREQSLRRRRAKTTLVFPLLGLIESAVPSTRAAFMTESPNLAFDAGAESCPRKDCAETRKFVIQDAARKDFVLEENNWREPL